MDYFRSPAFREKVRILLLTVCLLGLQFSWSVELAFGTPFLKGLGISSSVTALVWLAGPLSGFIMQPLVGAYSDACTSRYGRRRPFMVAGTVCSVISCFLVGWAPDISKWFSSDEATVLTLTQLLAVLGFYFLDFALNAVQAACRALIIDVAGKESQEVANAWAGRMIGLGGTVGFFFGTLKLKDIFNGCLGNSQMQAICVLGSIFLVFFVGLTCWTNPEVPLERVSTSEKKNPFHALISLKDSWKYLPHEAQQLCNVQFFAWIGWMPFYFYTTQWVGEAYRREYPDKMAGVDVKNIEGGLHARAGAMAMLLFSVVCLFASFVMPLMIAPRGSPSKNPITLPRMYTASHLLFACCLLLTPFGFKNVIVATALPTIAGLSYAVTAYAPFVILAECVDRNKAARESSNTNSEKKQIDPESIPQIAVTSDDPASLCLLESTSQLTLCLTEEECEEDEKPEATSVLIRMSDEIADVKQERAIEGGAILGIHNCYIVLPQFLTSLFTFVIFWALNEDDDIVGPDGKLKPPSDKDGFGWVLRLGGVSLLIAALLSLRIK